MTIRLLLPSLLAIICGELYILAVTAAEANATTATILSAQSPPKPINTPLICNCSFKISPFCTKNSTCDANKVAQVLRKRAQLMKEIVDKSAVSPDDETNNQARDDICNTLRDPDVVDSVLLEYLDEKNWTPACVSFDNDHKICSLAPAGASGEMNTADMNELKQKLHKDSLRCGQPSFAKTKNSMDYCRDKSFCNGALGVECSILATAVSILLCLLTTKLL